MKILDRIRIIYRGFNSYTLDTAYSKYKKHQEHSRVLRKTQNRSLNETLLP
jgi:hypothetical protein